MNTSDVERAISDAPEIADRMFRIVRDIARERGRQHVKWGTQRHSWPEWMAILGEEYGEACKESVEVHWQGVDIGFSGLRTELVHLAAVAVAIVEHIDELRESEGR